MKKKTKMRIGMILDHEFPPDTRVENEIIALKKAGFDVYILSLNFGTLSKTDKFYDAKIIRISIKEKLIKKMRPLTNTIFNIYPYYWSRHIIKFIKNYKIDVLHIHDLYLASAGIIANKKLKLPMLLDLHENYPEVIKTYTWANSGIGKYLVSPKKWKKLEGKYLKKYDKIIVLSDNFRDELLSEYRFLEKEKFIIYPNVPDVNQLLSYPIQNVLDKKEDEFYIFYFGVVGKRRGIFEAFEALRILIKKYKKIKLLLIGPVDKSDKNKFNKYINDDDIKDNIIYIPWIELKQFPSYCNLADIGIIPSYVTKQAESGIPNKFFQYLLFEVPIIVNNVKIRKDFVKKYNCGYTFEDRDVNNFVEKIVELYDDDELRKKMGKNGKKIVLEKYNLENACKDLVELYEKIEKNYK